MRRVLIDDVIVAARLLARAPANGRPVRLVRLCKEADRADAYRRREGRMHPVWGDGTLMAAALRRGPQPAPGLDDPDYRAALILVLTALDPQVRAQDRQVGIAGSAASRPGAISSPHSVQ